jgi:hypothetical protein
MFGFIVLLSPDMLEEDIERQAVILLGFLGDT